MIRRCSAPLLAVPDSSFQVDSALLAYGPGRKSDEALFVAAYLAGRWGIPLTVVTVRHQPSAGASTGIPLPIERARQYLELHDVKNVTYVEETGDPAQTILINAEAHSASLILMGGYEANPLRESILGSTVDQVLRSTHRPTLICR
jgi:nucleotide-binding universal stress UspA family protein